MPAFIWRKAAPGDYYLWEPGPKRDANVGRVWQKSPGAYAGRFFCGPFHVELRPERATPGARMGMLEDAIRVFLTDATFSRDNF